jgi:hypothetical protein
MISAIMSLFSCTPSKIIVIGLFFGGALIGCAYQGLSAEMDEIVSSVKGNTHTTEANKDLLKDYLNEHSIQLARMEVTLEMIKDQLDKQSETEK